MKVCDFVGSKLTPLQNAVQLLIEIVRSHDEATADALMKRDIQIGLFYYSDTISIGPFKLELMKEGYDEPYTSFRVIKNDGISYHDVETFDNMSLAIMSMADQYVKLYN